MDRKVHVRGYGANPWIWAKGPCARLGPNWLGAAHIKHCVLFGGALVYTGQIGDGP